MFGKFKKFKDFGLYVLRNIWLFISISFIVFVVFVVIWDEIEGFNLLIILENV